VPSTTPARSPGTGTGATGSSKGSIIWSALRALAPFIRAGLVQVWAIDPKGGMELEFGRELFHRYQRDQFEPIVGLLEDAAADMDTRCRRLHGTTRTFTPTPSTPLVLVVIDELATLTALLPERELLARVESALGLLLTKGRAPGYAVIAAVQDVTRKSAGGATAPPVVDLGEQVRRFAAGQLQVTQPAQRSWQRRGPDEAGHPVPEEVADRHRRYVVDDRRDAPTLDEGVPGRVAPPAHLVLAEVDDVRRARAIDVNESGPGGVEVAVGGERRRAGHQHGRAEPSVAKLRPVLHPSVPDQHLSTEAVAGHVGEEEVEHRVLGERRLRAGGPGRQHGVRRSVEAVGTE
jgi:hypothetical protein